MTKIKNFYTINEVRWLKETCPQHQLMAYLEQNSFITRTIYSQPTGRLKWRAAQDLKLFEEKGLITCKGRGNQKHYIKK